MTASTEKADLPYLPAPNLDPRSTPPVAMGIS